MGPWVNEPLVIPPLPSSHFIGCSIIDVDYFFEVNIASFINRDWKAFTKNKIIAILLVSKTPIIF